MGERKHEARRGEREGKEMWWVGVGLLRGFVEFGLRVMCKRRESIKAGRQRISE